jgi:hypothetical protein
VKRIGGVMVSVLTLTAVDHGSKTTKFIFVASPLSIFQQDSFLI